MKKQISYDETKIKMSDDASQPEVKTSKFFTKRGVGILALAYATSILAQNILFGVSGAPGYNDSMDVVFAYHAENQSALAITSGLETTNMVFLLLFLTALKGLVKRRGGDGADWSQLAMSAGATLSALFALTIGTHISVILMASSLTEPNVAFEMMWRLHAASFAISMPALGLTIIGTALSTHASGLTRPWQRLFGITIGIFPILAGFGNLAISNGSSLLFLGVLGLFLWKFWLIAAGVRLLRG